MSSLVLLSGVARRSACEMASRSSLIRFVSVDATAAVQSMASAVKQHPVRTDGRIKELFPQYLVAIVTSAAAACISEQYPLHQLHHLP
jgi:uncharacterized protein YdbL (DUF1318 family)